ncbi:hypothetical protein [Halosegnis marinus]|uniref:hypothetical protein n=1 Tax=Halosegnis marinus TaxID=3034023 RepID=UPI003620E324
MTDTDTRAQSQQLGVILLSVIAVSVVSAVAAPLVLDVDASTGPFVGAEVSSTTDAVTVVHGGGDSVPAADVTVVVATANTTERVALNTVAGERFAPGDAVRIDLDPAAAAGSLVRVQVVHGPSGEVYFSESVYARGRRPRGRRGRRPPRRRPRRRRPHRRRPRPRLPRRRRHRLPRRHRRTRRRRQPT